MDAMVCFRGEKVMRRNHSVIVIATISLASCAMAPPALADAVPGNTAAAPSSPAATAASSAAPAAPASSTAQPAEWSDIATRVKDLVSHYYPKAQIDTSDKSIHFEYKVKEVTGYYGDSLAPQPGGILGDIKLQSGDPPSDSATPQLVKDGSTSTTKMSLNPYSYKSHSHLVSQLTYPTKESGEFNDKFSAIITSFKCDAPAAPPVTVVTPPPQAQQPANTAGPLLEERKLIQDMIAKVKELGDNVSNYTQVQKYIEDRAHAGATETELRPTAEHLINELSDVCMGKIKDPITLQRESASSNSTAKPTSSKSGSGKSAAQQYTEETNRANKKKENEYKKGMSKEFWQKFHDEGHKPKT
jgi:hypothetical protein